jgi:ATP-dependent Clp protease adaptor protein ClpS
MDVMADLMAGQTVAPAPGEVIEERDQAQSARHWVTIVWNDPVNLMTYVTLVLQRLFGYSKEKATRLMLQVHHEGKAVVSAGGREQMEADVARLHAAGLWATLQQD